MNKTAVDPVVNPQPADKPSQVNDNADAANAITYVYYDNTDEDGDEQEPNSDARFNQDYLNSVNPRGRKS